jgi:MFS family permease
MMQEKIQHHCKTGWHNVLQGNILMLGLVSFFTDFSSEMIYPLLPVFLTGLVPIGAAAIYIGLMEGFSESISNILKIYSGRLSDAIKKRKLLAITGYGISTFFRPCMALATAGWMVVLFRFCDRIGKGVRTSPRDALISDSVSADVRGLAFSFHRAMDHAGAILGPATVILALYIFNSFGVLRDNGTVAGSQEMITLRWLFGASLIPGLAAMAFVVLKVKEIKPKYHEKENDELTGMMTGQSLPRKFYYLLGIIALFALGNSSDLFIVLYGKAKFGFDLFYVMLLWVILHISKIIFSLPGGALSDKFGRRIMIVAGWIVYIAVYIGMALVIKQETFWLLTLAYGAYYGLTEGAERALVADYVATQFRGKAYGLYHGVVGIIALPASILFGIIWAEFNAGVAFMVGAILALIATVLLIVLLSRRSHNLG